MRNYHNYEWKRLTCAPIEDKKKLPASFAPNCIIAAWSEEEMQEWLTEIQTICPLRDPSAVPFVVTAPFAHGPKCVPVSSFCYFASFSFFSSSSSHHRWLYIPSI